MNKTWEDFIANQKKISMKAEFLFKKQQLLQKQATIIDKKKGKKKDSKNEQDPAAAVQEKVAPTEEEVYEKPSMLKRRQFDLITDKHKNEQLELYEKMRSEDRTLQ